MTDYKKVFSEVIYILSFMEREMYEKIPLELIEYMEDNCDIDHNIEFDSKKSLEEQDIQEETKIVIATIYIDYIATQSEKKKIEQEVNIGFYIDESEKIGFDPKIFNNRIDEAIKNTNIEIENALVKKEKWFEKMLNKMKKIFLH